MNPRARRRVRGELAAYKREHGCADCPPGVEHDTDALQFDHREERDKRFNISAFWQHSVGEVWAEVANCDVRCANHHAMRTAARNRLMNAGELPRPNASVE